MSGFALTEEQELFKASVRQIAEAKIAPRAAEIDETDEYPWDIHKTLVENGLMAVGYPEAHGGVGGPIEFCAMVEEISRVSAGASLIPLVNRLGSIPLFIAASDEQQASIFPGIVDGSRQIAYCLTEPEAGSDAGAMKSRAAADGDGWILNGTKRFITNAGIADTYSYFAVTNPDAKKGKNVSLFLVYRDRDGFEVTKLEHKLGIKGSPTGEITMTDYRLEPGDLVGNQDEGFTYAMKTLDYSRPTIAAQALGIAQGAFDYAVGYAKERSQFGQPISHFQGIQFMLADMAMQIEASRMLTYRAASKVIEKASDVSYHAAIAKCYASDTAMKVTTDAVQILGGYGYVKEYPVERMMRDAKITQIYEGTNQIQRMVIGRTVTR